MNNSEWLDFSNDVKGVSIIVDSIFWLKKPHRVFVIYNLENKKRKKKTSAAKHNKHAHKSGCPSKEQGRFRLMMKFTCKMS